MTGRKLAASDFTLLRAAEKELEFTMGTRSYFPSYLTPFCFKFKTQTQGENTPKKISLSVT
jgi:hypothetical protein